MDRAVLEATAELLRQHGYKRLKVDDVAARARVGLGALYRRWPTKRDLVIAALSDTVPDRGVPTTEDARADVVAGLLAMSQGFAGPRSKLLSGLLSEMADDPELAEAVRSTLITSLRLEQRERMRRLLGDIEDLDERADLGPAWVLFQGLMLGRVVTEAELQRLLDVITHPGRAASGVKRKPTRKTEGAPVGARKRGTR